jgi:hypothetical protein
MVLDNDTSVLYPVASNVSTNNEFTFEVRTPSTIRETRTFAFYAVDSVGTVSPAASFRRTIEWPPSTVPRSPSPTRSRSWSKTQTLIRSLAGETSLATASSQSRSLTAIARSVLQTSVRTATRVPPTWSASRGPATVSATDPGTVPATVPETAPGTVLTQTGMATPLPTPTESVTWSPNNETGPAGKGGGTAKKIGTGAIVGIVIGLLVVIAVIVIILICRKKANPRENHSLDAKLADYEIFDEIDEVGKADFDL